MNRRKTATYLGKALLPVVFVSLFIGSTELQSAQLDVKQIAESATREIGTIPRSGKGDRGAAILIIEETHTSRSGQLEQAIALVRLHDEFGLRDIALEGYLKERPAINTAWFAKSSRGLTPTERTAVVAQMLRDGEISAAEFMELSYDDIALHPIETKAEHAVELKGDAATITITYLLKIAQNSLRETHVPKLQRLQSDIQGAQGARKTEKVKELLDFILSLDSWTKERGAALTDTNRLKNVTAERILAEVEEIEQRARTTSGVELEAKEKEAMAESLRFWRGRAAASRTMIAETGRIADRPGVKLVVLNIGAAHTEGMAAMLIAERRPYAVMRSRALTDRMPTSSDIDILNRKYKGLSVFNEGVTKQFLEAFPVRLHKKPEPVLDQPWFQAKAELHLFTARISRRVSPAPSGGGPRLPIGNAPFGFKDDDLRGQWIYIDPKRITIVYDDNSGKNKAVQFPVILNPSNPNSRKELWVKAGFSPAFNQPVISGERKVVEGMLKRHLEDVLKEEEVARKQESTDREKGSGADREMELETPKKAEDSAGRIQIDSEVRAAIAVSQAELAKIAVTAI